MRANANATAAAALISLRHDLLKLTNAGNVPNKRTASPPSSGFFCHQYKPNTPTSSNAPIDSFVRKGAKICSCTGNSLNHGTISAGYPGGYREGNLSYQSG